MRAIEECDVAMLMLDATQGIESQDMAIYSEILKNKKGVVILVNKWDLIEGKETSTPKEVETKIREKIAPFTDVPIFFISAHTKQRLLKSLEAAQQVYENRNKKIATNVLNEFMLGAVARHHPPAHRGHIVRIKYVTQIPARVPTFLFFTNHPQHVKESYRRYLENQLREHFGFTGVPINLFFRQK